MTDEELYKKINSHNMNELFKNLKSENVNVVEATKNTILELYNICINNENRVFKYKNFEFGFLVLFLEVLNLYYHSFYKDEFINSNGQFKQHFLANSTNLDKINVNKVIDILQKANNISNKIVSNKFINFHNPQIIQQVKNRQIGIIHDLGSYYAFYIDVEKAIECFKKAIQLGGKTSYLSLVYIYTRDEYLNLSESVKYYKEQLNNCNTINEKEYLFYLPQSFLTLLMFYYKKGLYSELKLHCEEFKQKFSKLYDVLFNTMTEQESEDYKRIYEILTEDHMENEILLEYFSKKTLSKMSNDIQTFIFTSLKVKKYIETEMNNNIILDFSSAVIPTMKALESVLFKIFTNGYLKFLLNKFNNNPNNFNFDLVQEVFISFNKNVNKLNQKTYKSEKYKNIIGLNENISEIELGKILYLSSKIFYSNGQKNIIPNEYFVEFCKEVCIFENNKYSSAEEYVIDFATTLFEVKELRNLTAHKAKVTKESANKAFEYLIEQYKFINKLYEDFYKVL